MNPPPPVLLLTFDVEDWFQVENLKQYIPSSSWANCEIRIEKNVHKILDLLDSINCTTAAPHHGSTAPRQHRTTAALRTQNSLDSSPHVINSPCSMPSAPCDLSSSPDASRLPHHGSIRATFFILGWIAERLPHLVREIQSRGHEIASHGYSHELCHNQPIDALRVDLVRSKKLLEDITGSPIYGYRAPSFSITDEALIHIKSAGYLYDSSFNAFRLHKRYGKINLNGNRKNGILHLISEYFYEIKISNFKIGNGFIPWGGGGYFRLIPDKIFNLGVLSILKRQGAYLFYLHPWEIDPDQPKVSNLPMSFRFRHYVNLDRTYSKLSSFLNAFKNFGFLTCFQYITQQTQVSLSPCVSLY